MGDKMAKDVNKTTTYQYKFNPKVGGYQPTSTTVVINEMIDGEAEMKAQKKLQDDQKKLLIVPDDNE